MQTIIFSFEIVVIIYAHYHCHCNLAQCQYEDKYRTNHHNLSLNH